MLGWLSGWRPRLRRAGLCCIHVADGAVAASDERSEADRPCDTLSPDFCYLTWREMWTGEKIIFVELSVIVPFFMDMTMDTFQFATHDYLFYMT